MKFKPYQLDRFRSLLEANAVRRGAKDLNHWKAEWLACVEAGKLPKAIKCEAVACLSYLWTGEAGEFTFNEGFSDSHVHTAMRRIYS